MNRHICTILPTMKPLKCRLVTPIHFESNLVLNCLLEAAEVLELGHPEAEHLAAAYSAFAN